jgi:hypothetical protein
MLYYIIIFLILFILFLFLYNINNIKIYLRPLYNYYYINSIKNIINVKDIHLELSGKNKSDLSEFCIDEIISTKQCKIFSNTVKNDIKLWKKKYIIMSILGTASYIEGLKGFSYYKDEYLKTNKILYLHYQELLNIVLNYFQKRCPNSTVKYRFALPGFHIFNCGKIFSLPFCSIHNDLQYLNLEFDEKIDLDLDKTLSFTLTLELPKTGGGLYIFGNEQVKINYFPGYIVCHNGKISHMISSSPQSNKISYRITLQGHGLYDKLSNTWYIYW